MSTEELPTFVVVVKSKQPSTQELAQRLRQYYIPIYGRLSENTLLLDFRTVLKGEEKIIVEAFNEILKRK